MAVLVITLKRLHFCAVSAAAARSRLDEIAVDHKEEDRAPRDCVALPSDG
jgi:hypothetical protein